MDWKSFEKELPKDDGKFILVCCYDFAIHDFRYDICQVENSIENKWNLLQLPWCVETKDAELLAWCYIDEPKSGFAKTNDDEFITVTQARKLLNCSVSTMYKFIHQEDFPKMQKADLKSYKFSKQEFIEWCKKNII